MPLFRGLLNSLSAVFLMLPCSVTITTFSDASKLLTATYATMVSPVSFDTRFAMDLPRAVRPPSGISNTLSQ